MSKYCETYTTMSTTFMNQHCTYNNIDEAHELIVGIAQCTHNNVDEIHELTLHNASTTITSENEF